VDSTVHSWHIDIGLNFKRDDRLGQHLLCYMDSDYTGDLNKCRSIIGYVYIC